MGRVQFAIVVEVGEHGHDAAVETFVIGRPELAKNAGDVALDGLLGHGQVFGDLFVGVALGHFGKDVDFPYRECFQRGGKLPSD